MDIRKIMADMKEQWATATDEEKIDIIKGGRVSFAMLQDGAKSDHPELQRICLERLQDPMITLHLGGNKQSAIDQLSSNLRNALNAQFIDALRPLTHLETLARKELTSLRNALNANLNEIIKPASSKISQINELTLSAAKQWAKAFEGWRISLLALTRAAVPELSNLPSDISYNELRDTLARKRPGWAQFVVKTGNDENADTDDKWIDVEEWTQELRGIAKTLPHGWELKSPDWLDATNTEWIDQLSFFTISTLLQIELERREADIEKREKALKQRRGKLEPIATNGFFPTPADRISKAVIESLAPGALKQKDEIAPALEALEARGAASSHTFWAAYTFDSPSKSKGELHGAIGYTKDPGDALWAMMETNNATAIKMQYILWARAYTETDAEPGQVIRLSVNQLCDDLGYKRKKGVHKRENKQRAGEVFEMLVQREIAVIVTDPKGKTVRLRGPIWNRGISADEYEDLFGANRAGDPASWIPSVLSYSPGDWFNDPAWRAYNRHIALISEGLLKLSGEKKDKYAVIICAYLGILARMNGYRPSFIKTKTLLEKSGLWAADGKSNPDRMMRKLRDALDRAKEPEIGFIKDWRYIGKDDPNIDYDNLDDPDTLAALADDGADPDERNRVIIIEWPDKLEERRIEIQAKQQKHLREGKKRRSTKPKQGE